MPTPSPGAERCKKKFFDFFGKAFTTRNTAIGSVTTNGKRTRAGRPSSRATRFDLQSFIWVQGSDEYEE